MRTRRQWIAGLILLCVTSVTLVGCGAGGKLASCQWADEVQTSVDHLRQTSVSENGLGALRDGLNQLKSDLAQLAANARGQFQPEVDAVRAAGEEVTAAVSTARADLRPASLAAVRTALTGLGTALQALRDALAGTC